MTTLSVSTDIYTSNANDTDFRQWGSTISAHLAAVGLVQSSDSGQINWTTVTKPTAGNNAMAGYEIWRLADSLDATAPIFIKIEYGNSNVTSNPGLMMSVGYATDGAGSLTGVVSDRRLMTNTAASVAGNAYVSKACFVDGFFGCTMYRDLQGTGVVPMLAMMVSRSVDDSGAVTTDGFTVVYAASGSAPSIMQTINMVHATKTTAGTVHTLFPSGLANTLTDDTPPNFQAVRSYQGYPKVRPVHGVATVYSPEISLDTQFATAMIGTVPRNYICLGNKFGTGNAAGLTNFVFCMLWE